MTELGNDLTCFSCDERYLKELNYTHFCGECFHRWRTDEDLIEDDQLESGRRRSINDILVCPCCYHDF